MFASMKVIFFSGYHERTGCCLFSPKGSNVHSGLSVKHLFGHLFQKKIIDFIQCLDKPAIELKCKSIMIQIP